MAKKKSEAGSNASRVKKKETGPKAKKEPNPAKKRVVRMKQGPPKKVAAPKPSSARRVARKKPSPAADKQKFRNLLIRMREHIAGQINFLSADNLSRTSEDAELDFRSEEQGTDNYDRDFALRRVSMEQNALFEIDEALQRIKLGTFGACERCEKKIEKNRLAVIPYSRLCVACQSAAESRASKPRVFIEPAFREAETSLSDTNAGGEEE